MISYKVIIPAVIVAVLVGLFIYASLDNAPVQAPIIKNIDIAPIHP
jgi:hypothetical protein